MLCCKWNPNRSAKKKLGYSFCTRGGSDLAPGLTLPWYKMNIQAKFTPNPQPPVTQWYKRLPDREIRIRKIIFFRETPIFREKKWSSVEEHGRYF